VKDTLTGGCFDIDTLTITVNPLPTTNSTQADTATCVNGVMGSNAAIAVRGIANMAKYAYSTTGLFALNATVSTTDSIKLTGLTNPSVPTTYTFRIWGADTTCFVDRTVVLNPAVCPTCSIMAVFTQNACNNNGTTSTGADDYFTVTVSGVTAINGGTSDKYEIVLNGNVLNTGSTAYGTSVTVGTPTTFKSDGSTTYQLTVRDLDIPICQTTVFVTTVSAACSAIPCKPEVCVPVTVARTN
jgi:hypothetical protein